MKNVVLCDIDHTISDASRRDYLLDNRPIDWYGYHSIAGGDEPVDAIVDLIRALDSQGYVVIGLTARPEKWRGITVDWLVRHDIPLEDLIMRPDDGFTPAAELKYNLAIDHFGSETELKSRVSLVLDDRDDIVEKFNGLGLVTLQVKI